jgi:essential nuclear protein 1
MPRAPSSNKLKKAAKGGSGSSSLRHDPLVAQIQADESASKFGKVSAPGRRVKGGGDAGMVVGKNDTPDHASIKVTGFRAGGGNNSEGSRFVDPKLSRNILRLAREQQEEIEAEEAEAVDGAPARHATRESLTLVDSDGEEGSGEDVELHSDEEEGDAQYEELEIDPQDAELMARFGQDEEGEERRGGNRTLADMIMEKIEAAERKTAIEDGIHEKTARRMDGSVPMPPGINPKVIEVYTKVGELLSRYKSGPLPKAFKIIPSLPAWENILYITNPATWTPHATLAATRIFVSNLKAAQSQRFFNLVLLDKIRDEIHETGKASYQMYEAIKKALFKPAAFFKGVLFPLCEVGGSPCDDASLERY